MEIDMRAFVIDTETGGLDAKVHSLLSLAIVCLDLSKKEVISSMYMDIKEDPIIVTEGALRVNRVELQQHYKSAITPKEATDIINSYVAIHGKDAVVIGHNVSFDISFVKRLFNFTSLRYEDIFSYRSVDTASILRYLYHSGRVDKDISSLDKALDFFGIDIEKEDRHTAIGDAKATAHLYLSLLDFT